MSKRMSKHLPIRQCATCAATTQQPFAHSWIVADANNRRGWVWECADCKDKRTGPTTTIAEFTIPARALPKEFV